ncbi:MAG: sulfatase-like hydrolase/transferase, partial [Vicinamibacteraceae bacterium]
TEARRKQLAGFRFYPRATTPFGRTELALSALFAGAPYDYSGEPIEYMSEAFTGRRSLLTRLKELGYWSVGYLQRVYPRGAPSPFDETYFHSDITDLSQDSGVDRLFLSLWLYATFPRALGRPLVPEQTWEQLETGTLLPDEAPVRSLHGFRKLIAVEGSRRPPPDAPRYVFAHLILPHVPLVLKADCTVQPGRDTTVLAQSECTLRTLLEVVGALEQRRRLRDALILIHADHGARHVVRNGELAEASGGSYGLEWSWGRARPLMLIKPAGVAAEAPLAIDERPADLYDVFPTILDSVETGIGLRLTGCSLLRAPCASRTRYYHFYDKADEPTIIDGTLKRYRIENGAIAFDREIPIQR